MAVTFNRLIELMSRANGFYFFGTATGGSTITIEDTSSDGFNALSDDRTTGKWARIVTDAGGSNAAPEEESRKVSSVSTTTATVDTAYSAEPVSGDTYELTPYHPQDMKDSIQQAIRQAWPTIYLPLVDESLVVDELLSNGLAETFTVANTPDNWTEVGTPTTTEENTRVFQGTSSIKSVPSAANEGYSQALFTSVNVKDVAGKTITFWAHGWSDGATGMKVRLSFDGGSTYSDSNAHSGSSEWERMEVVASVPATATSITAYLWNGTSGTTTVYWDFAHAHISPISRYTIPSSFVQIPHRISLQAVRSDPKGYYTGLSTHGQVFPGQIIRLEGKGFLTVPTTGTGTTEIDEVQAEFIIALASRNLFQRLASSDLMQRQLHLENRDMWAREAERLSTVPGVRSKGMAATKPDLGVVRYAADTSGSYIELPR